MSESELREEKGCGGSWGRKDAVMLTGTSWGCAASACGEVGTQLGIPVLGTPAPLPWAGATCSLSFPSSPPPRCQRSPVCWPVRCWQRVPPQGRGSPCVVVDGGGQGIPGAPWQDAQRLLHGLLPVRPLHESVHHLWGQGSLWRLGAGKEPSGPCPDPGGAESVVPPARAGPRPRLPCFDPS